MGDKTVYAQEYTAAQKKRIIAAYLLLAAVLVIPGYYWLVPELVRFFDTGHCHSVLGIPGLVAIVYGVFVGVPLLMSLTMVIILTPLGLRTIQQRQSPPSGVRVFRKTPVVTGRNAVIRGYLITFGLPLIMILVISTGYVYAHKLVQSINVFGLDYSICVERHNERSGL